MNSGKVLRMAAVLTGAALLAGVAGGCAWSIGEKKTQCCPKAAVAQPKSPTRGQELIDLKKAREQGAISEEEYQNQKKKLLEK